MRKILSIILILLSFLSYSNAQEKQIIGVLAAAVGQVFNQEGTQLKTVAVLTCKSFVKFGYRGERLIEPSSSWFPPKFPSG